MSRLEISFLELVRLRKFSSKLFSLPLLHFFTSANPERLLLFARGTDSVTDQSSNKGQQLRFVAFLRTPSRTWRRPWRPSSARPRPSPRSSTRSPSRARTRSVRGWGNWPPSGTSCSSKVRRFVSERDRIIIKTYLMRGQVRTVDTMGLFALGATKTARSEHF